MRRTPLRSGLLLLAAVAHGAYHGSPLPRRVWARHARPLASATAAAAAVEETDVIMIGSGFGGLSCAGLLASRGLEVQVLEQHYEIGGCACATAFRIRTHC